MTFRDFNRLSRARDSHVPTNRRHELLFPFRSWAQDHDLIAIGAIVLRRREKISRETETAPSANAPFSSDSRSVKTLIVPWDRLRALPRKVYHNGVRCVKNQCARIYCFGNYRELVFPALRVIKFQFLSGRPHFRTKEIALLLLNIIERSKFIER